MIALCVAAQTAPTVVDVANATVPIQIMAKSPADTATDLQVISPLSVRAREYVARLVD